jgi:hypothetical protein
VRLERAIAAAREGLISSDPAPSALAAIVETAGGTKKRTRRAVPIDELVKTANASTAVLRWRLARIGEDGVAALNRAAALPTGPERAAVVRAALAEVIRIGEGGHPLELSMEQR